MRVLIVEDERPLGLFLQKGLQMEGHDARWVEDGEIALEEAERFQPDLVVLDLNLPKKDGVEVLEALHELAPQTAVIVLTGRGSVEERVRCLNLGADDCLLKPFSFHELSARCRAILRRLKASGDAWVRYGSVELDLLRRKAWRGQKELDLTAKEFALLESLLRRKGECCSREELLNEVWHLPDNSTTNVVDVYVNYLRKKLTAAAPAEFAGSSLIQTVRGAGYRVLTLANTTTRTAGSPELLARGA